MLCLLRRAGKRDAGLQCIRRTRDQTSRPELIYLFAPTESRAPRLYGAESRGNGCRHPAPGPHPAHAGLAIKSERLAANAIEAAEQCGLLSLPVIQPEARLEQALAELPPEVRLIFCDEEAPLGDALAALASVKGQPHALLIGPEGGFDERKGSGSSTGPARSACRRAANPAR